MLVDWSGVKVMLEVLEHIGGVDHDRLYSLLNEILNWCWSSLGDIGDMLKQQWMSCSGCWVQIVSLKWCQHFVRVHLRDFVLLE